MYGLSIRLFRALCPCLSFALFAVGGCGASRPDEPGHRAQPHSGGSAVAQAAPTVSAPAAIPEAPTGGARDGRTVGAVSGAHHDTAVVSNVREPAPPPVSTVAARPAERIRFERSFAAPVSAPVAFEVIAIAMRDTVKLRSFPASDAAGFACAPAGARVLDVLRFAHFGRADSPFAMQWVLYMPEGTGTLTAQPAAAPGGGYDVTLRCDLRFDMIMRGATKPLKLEPRMTPEFTGHSKTWPPKGATLSLANGPIPFYVSGERKAKGAMMRVLDVRFSFGKGTTAYQARPPKIVGAELVDSSGHAWRAGAVGGARITWAATDAAVAPVTLVGYTVYRAIGNEPLARIAQVSASETSYVDSSYDGRGNVRYAVAHRTLYTPQFTYESMPGGSVTIRGNDE